MRGPPSSLPKGSCVVTESDEGEINVVVVSSASAPLARIVRVCPTSGALSRVGGDDAERSGRGENEKEKKKTRSRRMQRLWST